MFLRPNSRSRSLNLHDAVTALWFVLIGPLFQWAGFFLPHLAVEEAPGGIPVVPQSYGLYAAFALVLYDICVLAGVTLRRPREAGEIGLVCYAVVIASLIALFPIGMAGLFETLKGVGETVIVTVILIVNPLLVAVIGFARLRGLGGDGLAGAQLDISDRVRAILSIPFLLVISESCSGVIGAMFHLALAPLFANSGVKAGLHDLATYSIGSIAFSLFAFWLGVAGSRAALLLQSDEEIEWRALWVRYLVFVMGAILSAVVRALTGGHGSW